MQILSCSWVVRKLYEHSYITKLIDKFNVTLIKLTELQNKVLPLMWQHKSHQMGRKTTCKKKVILEASKYPISNCSAEL